MYGPQGEAMATGAFDWNMVDEASMQALVDEAEQAYADGTITLETQEVEEVVDEEEETAADEAAETPEEQAAEAAAGTEMHSPQTFADMVASVVEEVASYEQQIEQLVEQAKNADDGDAKKVKSALSDIGKIVKQVEKLKEQADKAVEKEDIGKAAEAAADADELCKQAEELLSTAKDSAGTPAPMMGMKGGKGNEFGLPSKGKGEDGKPIAPAGKASPKRPPLAVWASRD